MHTPILLALVSSLVPQPPTSAKPQHPEFHFPPPFEAVFGKEIDWRRLEDKKASRIFCAEPMDSFDKANWPKMIQWMVSNVPKLEQAFGKRLGEISARLKSGGVIGVEFASFFSSLGVKVDVIEMLDEIIPFMDRGQAKRFRASVKKKIGFNLGCRVTAIDGHDVKYTDKKGEEKSINADLVLMSVGRAPNLGNMGFEEAGLDFDRSGIKADDQMRTNLPNVFAIGDVTGKSQLAHSATRMGEVALNTILGKKDTFRTNAIPWAVYSMPEIAGCGMTEEQAKEAGHKVESASLPLLVSGRFLAENGKKGPGQVKVVIDADTRVLLGVHMFGGICSEIIWGVAALLEAELRVEDVQEIVFPHPTVGEVIRSAMFQL